MGLREIIGSFILGGSIAVSCAAQEITSSVTQQGINGGVQTSTVSTSVADDEWGIFANYSEITSIFSDEHISIVGGSLDIFGGKAEFAAINIDSGNLFSEEESQTYLVSFSKDRLKGTIGAGDGTLARLQYQITPHMHAAVTYSDGMRHLHMRDISEQRTPIPQRFFFNTIPTRFDIPSILWDQKLSGLGATWGYDTQKDSISATYHKGERPFLGIGLPTDFTYYSISQQHEGKFYDIVEIELGQGDFIHEGRISMETGVKVGRLHVGAGGYLHGIGDTPSAIFEYYNGAGLAFLLSVDLGKVTLGTVGTFEEDRTTATELLQAGLLLKMKGHEFLFGPTESSQIHRFFSEPNNGWMFASKHDFGKWNISAHYVTDDENNYGTLSVGWCLP